MNLVGRWDGWPSLTVLNQEQTQKYQASYSEATENWWQEKTQSFHENRLVSDIIQPVKEQITHFVFPLF